MVARARGAGVDRRWHLSGRCGTHLRSRSRARDRGGPEVRKLRSLGSNVASAIVGALIGALIVMGGDSLTRTPDPEPPGRPPSPEINVLEKGSGGTRSPSRILLAWSPREGLPPTTERGL